MKRLLLDHFRRKAWILALGAVAEFLTSFASAHGRDGDALLSLQLQAGLFLGPFLLSLDLQRGIARPLATLPLTTRQVGTAWWLATVAIPAAAYSALMFLGAGLARLLSPRASADWGQIALSGLLLLLWMGTAFPILGNLTAGQPDKPRHGKLRSLAGILWGLMIGGGYLFLRDLSQQPVRLACFLVAGLVATVFGCVHAGRFFDGDGTSRPPAPPDRQTDRDNRPAHRPGGRGGLPLLLGSAFVRSFLTGLALIVALPLLTWAQGGLTSWRDAFATRAGAGFMPFWLVTFFALAPLLTQLRLLRSLPLSTTRLAAVQILAVLLPLLALGTLHAASAWLVLGDTPAAELASSYLLACGSAAFSVFFVSWLGAGFTVYFLIGLLTIFTQLTPLYLHPAPLRAGLSASLTGLIALASVGIAFVFTRRALLHGHKAYRAPAVFVAWGGRR